MLHSPPTVPTLPPCTTTECQVQRDGGVESGEPIRAHSQGGYIDNTTFPHPLFPFPSALSMSTSPIEGGITTKRSITVSLLAGTHSVVRLPVTSANVTFLSKLIALPGTGDLPIQSPMFIQRTDKELSVVLDSLFIAVMEDVMDEKAKCDGGWTAFEVQGPMEFEIVGVMAKLSSTLAEKGVSLLAQSTFDTDYIYVKKVSEAIEAWELAVSC